MMKFYSKAKLAASVLTLAFMTSTTIANADLKKEAEAIDAMEKALQAKVQEYNKRLKEVSTAKEAASKAPEKAVVKIEAKADHNGHAHSTPAGKTAAPVEGEKATNNKELENLSVRVTALETLVFQLAKGDIVGLTPEQEKIYATIKAQKESESAIANTKAIAQYNKAMEFYNKGDHTRAIEAFKEVVRVYPNDPYTKNALVRIADSEHASGKHGKAIDYYNRAMSRGLEGDIYNDATLGHAAALFDFGARGDACKILITFNDENKPMTPEQNAKFQKYLVAAECSSKMDKAKELKRKELAAKEAAERAKAEKAPEKK